jgi:hypothetical protein
MNKLDKTIISLKIILLLCIAFLVGLIIFVSKTSFCSQSVGISLGASISLLLCIGSVLAIMGEIFQAALIAFVIWGLSKKYSWAWHLGNALSICIMAGLLFFIIQLFVLVKDPKSFSSLNSAPFYIIALVNLLRTVLGFISFLGLKQSYDDFFKKAN